MPTTPTESPFDPMFDPDRDDSATPAEYSATGGCYCGMTRRQTLAFAVSLAALPMVAVAQPFVPCVQTQQKITPCQHKFCRFYRGDSDYYRR